MVGSVSESSHLRNEVNRLTAENLQLREALALAETELALAKTREANAQHTIQFDLNRVREELLILQARIKG